MTTPPPGDREVHAEQSGVTAGGDVHLQAGRDAIGRDRISIDNLVVAPPPVDRTAALDDEQHARFAALVRRQYRDRLAQSLDRVVRLELGLDADAGAVSQPLDRFVPRDHRVQPLPAGTSILEVFTTYGGEQGGLLILGDPGAGKTTMLIELALALITEADPSRPVPTYVPLSTWQQHRRPVVEWLAEQLNQVYFVPRATAQRWVQTGRVLPLLDGLDELDDLDGRTGCVSAINEFRQQYALPVVVCSRRAEYQTLPRQLALEAAVVIRPLDPGTVLRHLELAGPALAGVRAMLRDDPDLLELCRSPLLLSMLTLTYQGQTADELHVGRHPEQRRERLFSDYVTRRLDLFDAQSGAQKVKAFDGQRKRTLHWIAALARNLNRHNQKVFLLERMEPDWLSVRRAGTTVSVLAGVFAATSGSVLFATIFRLDTLIRDGRMGLSDGLIYGLSLGLVSGVVVWFGGGKPAERLTWSWRTRRKSWRSSVGAGMRGALSLAAALGAASSLNNIIYWLSDSFVSSDISPFAFNHFQWLVVVIANGLLGAIEGALVGALVGTLFVTDVVARTIRPNEGIRRSLRNSGLLFVIAAPLGWLPFGVGYPQGPVLGVVYGMYSGLAVALLYGLGAVLQHVALRVLLWRYGLAPLRYVRWLEEMVRARLLYRVGGGYEFVHVLLRNHLERHGPKS